LEELVYFCVARAAKEAIGGELAFAVRTRSRTIIDLKRRNPANLSVIRGYSKKLEEGEEGGIFWVGKDEPYLIYREEADISKNFILKLSHKNPQECKGPFTAEEAVEEVAKAIMADGNLKGWPNSAQRNYLKDYTRNERNRQAREAKASRPTFDSVPGCDCEDCMG
jgi:hypothetical protein